MALISAEGIVKDTVAAFLEINTNNSVQVNLGDNAGANTFQIDNTTPASVFSIDSDGDCDILGTLTVQGGITDTKFAVICAEENGTLGNNSFEWSYGNGLANIGAGYVPQRSGRVLGLSLVMVTAGAGATIVEIQRRLTTTKAFAASRSLTVPAGAPGDSIIFGSPMTFSPGSDYLVFRTATAGGGGFAVISALLEFD